MCGIIGILSRPGSRTVPTAQEIVALLDTAVSANTDLSDVAHALIAADQLLRGDAGIQSMVNNPGLASEILSRLDRIDVVADAEEARIDSLHGDSTHIDAEVAKVSRVRDAAWAIRRDRLRAADAVRALAGTELSPSWRV